MSAQSGKSSKLKLPNVRNEHKNMKRIKVKLGLFLSVCILRLEKGSSERPPSHRLRNRAL